MILWMAAALVWIDDCIRWHGRIKGPMSDSMGEDTHLCTYRRRKAMSSTFCAAWKQRSLILIRVKIFFSLSERPEKDPVLYRRRRFTSIRLFFRPIIVCRKDKFCETWWRFPRIDWECLSRFIIIRISLVILTLVKSIRSVEKSRRPEAPCRLDHHDIPLRLSEYDG